MDTVPSPLSSAKGNDVKDLEAKLPGHSNPGLIDSMSKALPLEATATTQVGRTSGFWAKALAAEEDRVGQEADHIVID